MFKKEYYNKLNYNLTDNSDDYDKDNLVRITSKNLNSNYQKNIMDVIKNKDNNL